MTRVVNGIKAVIRAEAATNREIINQSVEVSQVAVDKLTTPDDVPGTIGETVAAIKVGADEHARQDDLRIAALWNEMGKKEPKPKGKKKAKHG